MNEMNTAQMVEAVRDFALANYEVDGWDFVVEACTDEEIIRAIGSAYTAKGAIRKVRALALLLEERSCADEATAW